MYILFALHWHTQDITPLAVACDVTATLLHKVCNDVTTEPPPTNHRGFEVFGKKSSGNEAKLDISV